MTEQKRVVILEDDADWQDILSWALEDCGADVIFARTLAELLALSEEPIVLSLDGNLPDGNSPERLPDIQRRFPHARIVFLSGDTSVRQCAQQNGIPSFKKNAEDIERYKAFVAKSLLGTANSSPSTEIV